MRTPTPTAAPLTPDDVFRAYWTIYPLDGVDYSAMVNVVRAVCSDFDDGATADAIWASAYRHFGDRSQAWLERLASLIGAGVQAFCPEHSAKFG